MQELCPILLFDGVCNLCNRLVIFIIKRDKRAEIKFAPLQSPAGEAWLKKCNLAINDTDSIVYIEGNNCFTRSLAVLHLFKTIGGRWSLIYGIIIIPKFIRDYFYDLIAKRRYRIFGKSERCMVPSQDISDRFAL